MNTPATRNETSGRYTKGIFDLGDNNMAGLAFGRTPEEAEERAAIIARATMLAKAKEIIEQLLPIAEEWINDKHPYHRQATAFLNRLNGKP